MPYSLKLFVVLAIYFSLSLLKVVFVNLLELDDFFITDEILVFQIIATIIVLFVLIKSTWIESKLKTNLVKVFCTVVLFGCTALVSIYVSLWLWIEVGLPY